MVRSDSVRLGSVRYGMGYKVWFGKVGFGEVGYGKDSMAWLGSVLFRLGKDSGVRLGEVWYGTVGRGKVRHGKDSMVWRDTVWSGLAWLGKDSKEIERSGLYERQGSKIVRIHNGKKLW